MNLRVTREEPLRLMSVHAHPDDESSKGAATLAKYAAEGVDVRRGVVTFHLPRTGFMGWRHGGCVRTA